MHDCYESSVNAALRIVDILKESGYEFVTVEELILHRMIGEGNGESAGDAGE